MGKLTYNKPSDNLRVVKTLVSLDEIISLLAEDDNDFLRVVQEAARRNVLLYRGDPNYCSIYHELVTLLLSDWISLLKSKQASLTSALYEDSFEGKDVKVWSTNQKDAYSKLDQKINDLELILNKLE